MRFAGPKSGHGGPKSAGFASNCAWLIMQIAVYQIFENSGPGHT